VIKHRWVPQITNCTSLVLKKAKIIQSAKIDYDDAKKKFDIITIEIHKFNDNNILSDHETRYTKLNKI